MSYREGDESTFTHWGKEYRVDDLIALTNGHKLISVPIKDLMWNHEDNVSRGVFDSAEEQKRIDAAMLYYPLIVTRSALDKSGKLSYVVLDGNHRLAKAVKLHKQYVYCYVIDEKLLNGLSEVKRK